MHTRALGSSRPPPLRHRPRLHGHVRPLRPGRRGREHRHHPRRARRRHHPARHRRLLRHGPQRAADRARRCAAATASRSCSASSSAPCATPAGSWLGFDARPAAVKNFLAYTLRRLGTDHVDIYRPGRVDPDVPIEETVGAIARAGRGRLRPPRRPLRGRRRDASAAPHAVHPISDLQIEYSLLSRGIEDEILPDLPRARHRHHRLRRPLARPAQRPLVDGPRAGRRRLPRSRSPLQRREPRAQPRARRGAARDRRREGRDGRAGRDRLGALPRRRTSCRSSAPAAATGSPRRSARSSSTLGADDLAAIERAVPPAPPPASATTPADGDPRQRTPVSEGPLTPGQIVVDVNSVVSPTGQVLTIDPGSPVGCAAVGDPNQVISASVSPRCVRSPTQATYPSGRINTAVGAVTEPNTGSLHSPAYSAWISRTRSDHGATSRPVPGAPRLSSTGRASCSRVNTRSGPFRRDYPPSDRCPRSGSIPGRRIQGIG